MHKSLQIAAISLFFILSLFSFTYSQNQEEQLTITTYYPAPAGSYHELRVDQMSVGSGYRQSTLSDGNLIVEGNMSIGTSTPERKVHIVQRQSGNGLIIDFPGTPNIRTRLSNEGTGGGPFGGVIGTESAHSFGVSTNGQRRLHITADGHVGIGTTTPGNTMLAVNGTSASITGIIPSVKGSLAIHKDEVYMQGLSGRDRAAVYGYQANIQQWGGYFDGDVKVRGDLYVDRTIYTGYVQSGLYGHGRDQNYKNCCDVYAPLYQDPNGNKPCACPAGFTKVQTSNEINGHRFWSCYKN